mmetsp:Transcript_24865/g.44751  ORF Transcript_24865/g.44751 Transcript_24865/m.44751 type:complete len:358 (+) Transcript_24865:221-1294(+)
MMLPSAVCLGLAIQASFLLSFCRPFSTNNNPRIIQHVVPTSSSSSSTSLRSQILDFVEPTTGVRVKLVGAMHYNPSSIKLATDSINALEADGQLGSIIIESCDIRWNATMESNLVKEALMSEMKAAHDLGMKYQRPVVLGDQRINITVSALKSGAKEAVLDLFQPWNGGWGRLTESISSSRKVAVPTGDQYLGLGSFLDPKLWGAAPVSFIKYPLSYFVKSPLFAAAVFGLIILGGVDSSDAYVADSASATDLLQSLSISILETVIFARIFLKELLADRNEVLAESILEQCRNYEAESSSGWLEKLFQTNNNGDKSTGAIYAPGSVVGKPEDGKTVVAVLGLAHCNGIKKLLTETES